MPNFIIWNIILIISKVRELKTRAPLFLNYKSLHVFFKYPNNTGLSVLIKAYYSFHSLSIYYSSLFKISSKIQISFIKNLPYDYYFLKKRFVIYNVDSSKTLNGLIHLTKFGLFQITF